MRFFVTTLVLLIISRPAHAGIAIINSTIWADAFDNITIVGANGFFGTTIPTHTTLNSTDGLAYSRNVIDWSLLGNQTTLSLEMDHKRAAKGWAETKIPDLRFTANANEPYQMSGYYNVTDTVAGQASTVHLAASLYDQTLGVYLFQNLQESRGTTNEQFVLGESGGTLFNTLVGSPNGNLIAGHIYSYVADVYLNNALTIPNSGARALGNLRLTIGVPEPASVLLCWAGIGVIQLCHRRRRLLNA